MPITNQIQKDCEAYISNARMALILMAHRYLKADDVEDAVQETIKRFYVHCSDGHSYDRPDAFLYGILKNVIKEIGSQNRKKIVTITPDTLDPDPPPDEIISHADSCEKIKKAFEKLPPSWQELLWDHFVEKKSFNELEHAQGIPHSTLYRKIKKCLKKFARELKKSGINWI